MNDLTFEETAVVLSIYKMLFVDGHFSVCDIQNAGDSLGFSVSQNSTFPILRNVHCMDYKDMDSEFIDQLRIRTLSLLPQHIRLAVLRKAEAPYKKKGPSPVSNIFDEDHIDGEFEDTATPKKKRLLSFVRGSKK